MKSTAEKMSAPSATGSIIASRFAGWPAAAALVGLFIFAQIGWPAPAWAAAGNLDPTFGSGGLVITDFGGTFDEAGTVALQPDGKIVVTVVDEFSSTGVSDFTLVRYNPDGSLDVNFGSGGRVSTDFLGSDDEAEGVAVQPDGKIVAAGRAFDPATGNTNFALARYNPDGSLDLGFGSGGKVTTDFFGSSSEARALALLPDGKIVVAGHVGGQQDFALARYNADGSSDATFGVSGKVTTDFFGGSEDTDAVAVQPDGKIVVAGRVDGTTGTRPC